MAHDQAVRITNLPTALAYCAYARLARKMVQHDAPFMICVVLEDPAQFEFHEAAVHQLTKRGPRAKSRRDVRPYFMRRVTSGQRKPDSLLEEALSHRQVFLLYENEDDISDEVRAAADKVHVFGRFSPSFMRAAVFLVTGDKMSDEDSAFVASAPWRLAAMAFRPGRSTARALDRVRFWIDLRSTDAAVTPHAPPPTTAAKEANSTLDKLHGYGEAREWGLRLKKDLDDFRAGRIALEDVDSGLLLSGPPGCGKTMFAQALAVSFREVVHSKRIEETGVTTRPVRRIASNEHS